MPRPTVFNTMTERERVLAANMYLRNENWEDIFKYISIEDTFTAQQTVKTIAEQLERPWSDALYMAYLELAQTEYIMRVASEKAEDGSPRHMSEYKKLGEHKIKLVNQIDDLTQKETDRGHSWEPTFSTDDPEFQVFKAAVEVFLTRESTENDHFQSLSPEEQARFYQILSEGG